MNNKNTVRPLLSLQLLLILGLMVVLLQTALATNSLRFFGNGTGDIDRVKIQIDDPANSLPGPPADIGAEDFTIEFWMKAASGNNATASNSQCGSGWYSWINGNTIIDRDRFNQGRNYGIAIVNGVIWFGLENGSGQAHTLCGATSVTDGQWHHVVAQRRRSDGYIWLYVDGNLEASADGPDGDISYPDNGIPGNYCSGPCDYSDPYLVIGAEKHDAGSSYPSYSGNVDELRLSNSLRYPTSAPYSFSVPTSPFATDSNTMALYSFDEGSGTNVLDTSGMGPSHGFLSVGGNPVGPVWSTDTPFSGGGTPVPGIIQFTETAATIDESGVSRTFTVSRSGGSGAVSIDYVIGDTGSSATESADYASTAQVASGTLSWADGNTTSQSLTIDILDDNDALEGDETVVLTLSNPTGGASLGSNSSATLTIQDNDAPGILQFSTSSQGVNEAAGTATLTVTRTSGTSGLVTVDYAITGGNATDGIDYQNVQPASGTLTFQNGQSFATITLTVLDDIESEPLESVNFSLSNPTNGASLGGRTSLVLGIIDNDSSSGDPGTLGEGSGSFHPLFLALVLLLLHARRRQRFFNRYG